MAPWLHWAALPPSLLCFLTHAVLPSVASSQPWPYNLPPDAKYYPEDERLIRRDIDIQQRLLQSPARGVRKMSGDPGEKFYLDYWQFELEGNEEREMEEDKEGGGNSDVLSSWANTTSLSSWMSFDSPVRLHDAPTDHGRSRLLARIPGWHLFDTRDFKCPTGTSACTSINRPDSCCGTGSTCIIVQDTGLGDVGCCPNGQTCAGSLGACADGYTDCPNNPGGGCCIPGYACFQVGCVQTNTATLAPAPGASTTTVTSYTTVTPSAPTSSTSRTTSSSSSSSSTSTLPPQIVTVTRTVTVTSSASTTNSLTCSQGYRSCPASQGGGCCPTDRACGSANCPETTTTGSAAPPVRPTTETTTTETTTTVPGSTSTSDTDIVGCPTGFYACSAYYQGGCCQVGRDCGSTSCPASASTTLVDSNGITIVAPTGSGITAPASLLTGSCAQGWATCAPSVGGGCCPSGYACETATCAAVSGGSDVGKLAPESGASRAIGGDGMGVMIVFASLMSCLVGILGLVL